MYIYKSCINFVSLFFPFLLSIFASFLFQVPLDADSDLLSLQQELFNVGPDILAPAVAELEMLKKEQEERKVEFADLQMKAEAYLEEKEKLERYE